MIFIFYCFYFVSVPFRNWGEVLCFPSRTDSALVVPVRHALLYSFLLLKYRLVLTYIPSEAYV